MSFTNNNAYALVVGIANYQHIRPLPTAVLKDAQDIHDLLTDIAYCGYQSDNVALILDGQATQSAIRQALADLARRSDAQSSILIYISSHGEYIESGSLAGEYLLPVDVKYTSDQSLVDGAISGKEFTQALHAIRARKIVVIFDCCHAGGIGQPKDAGAQEMKTGLPEGYYETLKQGTGRVILASSRATELSWILPGAQNSLFTQHLLAGLKGGITSDDGLIRIFDLFEYVQPRVTADKSIQHPIFKAEIEENFAVALYCGGKKGVVPKDQDGFRYDAYISYVNREPDAEWVWKTLVPKLEAARLRVAVSGDVEAPGVDRVVNIERGIRQSKRTVVVLSDTYLAGNFTDFENVLAQTMGIQEGAYRLLPVKIAPVDESKYPTRLSMLTTLDFNRPNHGEREFDRLVQALQGPLPTR